MKSDIALHEIMRIDEYEDEHAEVNSADKQTPNQAQTEKETSLGSVATQEPEAEIDRDEPPVSMDIPGDTVINYDEPPTKSAEVQVTNDEIATESADTELAEVQVTNDEIATESPDTAAAEPVSNDDETDTESADTSAAQVLVNNDETAPESVDTDSVAALTNTEDNGLDAETISASELVMNDEISSDAVDTDTTTADEPPTELIDAPADETVMSNDVTPSELAELSTVKDPIDLDDISTESAALPTEPAIDYEESTPELANLPAAETLMYDGETSLEDPLEKRLEAIPANTAGFFGEVISTVSIFLKNSRQLLTSLGVVFLAFIVTKLAFAGLNAIDDFPLVSPLLKLVGLYYVIQFIWNYLIRQRDRQKLVEKINNTKAEVLGDGD